MWYVFFYFFKVLLQLIWVDFNFIWSTRDYFDWEPNTLYFQPTVNYNRYCYPFIIYVIDLQDFLFIIGVYFVGSIKFFINLQSTLIKRVKKVLYNSVFFKNIKYYSFVTAKHNFLINKQKSKNLYNLYYVKHHYAFTNISDNNYYSHFTDKNCKFFIKFKKKISIKSRIQKLYNFFFFKSFDFFGLTNMFDMEVFLAGSYVNTHNTVIAISRFSEISNIVKKYSINLDYKTELDWTFKFFFYCNDFWNLPKNLKPNNNYSNFNGLTYKYFLKTNKNPNKQLQLKYIKHNLQRAAKSVSIKFNSLFLCKLISTKRPTNYYYYLFLPLIKDVEYGEKTRFSIFNKSKVGFKSVVFYDALVNWLTS